MADYETLTLEVPASNGEGAALNVDGRDGKYVNLKGTFSADVSFVASFDGGSTYDVEVGSLSEPGGFFFDHPATHIKTVVTNYSSGTPSALVRVST